MEWLTRAEYIAPGSGDLQAASARFWAEAEFHAARQECGSTELEDFAAMGETMARISEEALAEMRALPPPREAARARFSVFYSLAEQQIDVLRQAAGAASAGDSARVEMLSTEELVLRYQIDWLLGGCPVAVGQPWWVPWDSNPQPTG